MKNVKNIALSLVLASSLANAAGFGAVEYEAKKDTTEFDKLEVGFNVDLTYNYQGLENDFVSASSTAKELQPGLTLPQANVDLNAKIMKGFNIKLETNLASHHHHETWVKGGYASIDSLDFVEPGFAQGFMDQATIRVGVNDINFGDAHFRRSDNADVFKNPFITNLAVESYMQAGFVELVYRLPSVNSLVSVGITNGQVNPSDVNDGEGKDAYGFYGKFAYDKQYNDALRVRVSESIYYTDDSTKSSFYSGDKAGNVIIGAFDTAASSSDFGAAWNALGKPWDFFATMTNVLVKYNNTEFNGLFETGDAVYQGSGDKKLTHYSLDLVQRFGKNNRFYAAARYENAKVTTVGSSTDEKLTQEEIALGWFLSKNALAKVQYFKQERENFSAYTGKAQLDGFMVSAALSF